MNIEQLVNDYPNDMELGKKVRELYLEARKFQDKLSEKMKDAKIFESPDGGRTIYVRGWGEPSSSRKLSTKQLNIFNETN